MSERDLTKRLRRAVKGELERGRANDHYLAKRCSNYLENNLALVKRLVQRTDMRNPDPSQERYTSLAWAAVCGCEDTFEYLLSMGHDDEELSKVNRTTMVRRHIEADTLLSLRTRRKIQSYVYWPV